MRNGGLLGSDALTQCVFFIPSHSRNLFYYIVKWMSLVTLSSLSGMGPVPSLPLERSLLFWSLEQLHAESITSARRAKRVMVS